MIETLWLTALLAAQLWAAGGRGSMDNPGAATPILAPVKLGKRPECVDPPSIAEILRALPAAAHGDGAGYIEYVTEKLVDEVDPPRFFPLIGPAQLHHCHWKCTVYFVATRVDGSKSRTEVVYVDKDHFHLCAAQQADVPPKMAEPKGYCPGGHYLPPNGFCPGSPKVRMDGILIDSENLRRTHVEPRKFFELPSDPEKRPVRPLGAPDILVIQAIQLQGKKPLDVGALSNICGEHLIRPDGMLSLGQYGSAQVGGLTVAQVKSVVEDHLKSYFVNPQVSVEVKAYNSSKIYIITEAGAGQEVTALPWGDNATVLDALTQSKTLPTARQKIWVSRPSKDGKGKTVILPVDWQAITQSGRTETNFELCPGDRIHIGAKIAQAGSTEESAAPPCELPMSLTDIVRLSKRGIAEDIIVRQMELTGSVFQLTVEEILSLNEQGVSDNLIREMQFRSKTATPAPTHLTPYRIQRGVGPSSPAIE